MLAEQWRDLLQELAEFVHPLAERLDSQSAGVSSEVSRWVAARAGAKECRGECLPVGPGSAAVTEVCPADRLAAGLALKSRRLDPLRTAPRCAEVGDDLRGVGWAGGRAVGRGPEERL